MLERGDREGQLVWLRIRRAIVELQAVPVMWSHPKPRQHRNSVLGDEEDRDRRREHETGAAYEGE